MGVVCYCKETYIDAIEWVNIFYSFYLSWGLRRLIGHGQIPVKRNYGQRLLGIMPWKYVMLDWAWSDFCFNVKVRKGNNAPTYIGYFFLNLLLVENVCWGFTAYWLVRRVFILYCWKSNFRISLHLNTGSMSSTMFVRVYVVMILYFDVSVECQLSNSKSSKK